jgi:hypothetical protein
MRGNKVVSVALGDPVRTSGSWLEEGMVQLILRILEQ